MAPDYHSPISTGGPAHGALLVAALFLMAGCASLQGRASEPPFVENRVMASPDHLAYLVRLPLDYGAPDDKPPLLVFLHGSGERGGALDQVLIHGPWRHGTTEEAPFRFVVVAPHLPAGAKWHPKDVMAVIEDVKQKYAVDNDRIYLTGLSLGGHGTWATATQFPTAFAAVAPISGRGDPDEACRLLSVPVWAFHGAVDDVVPASGSSKMVRAIADCGGAPGLTIYPDVGHDAWTTSYADPRLYQWMVSHHRQAE